MPDDHLLGVGVCPFGNPQDTRRPFILEALGHYLGIDSPPSGMRDGEIDISIPFVGELPRNLYHLPQT